MMMKSLSFVGALMVLPAIVLGQTDGNTTAEYEYEQEYESFDFPRANIHFLMDRSTSIVDFTEKCKRIDDAGGLLTQEVKRGWDCWDLFANFVENTVLQVQKTTRRQLPLNNRGEGYFDWERNNLKVSVRGFGCKGGNAPATMKYVGLTSNPQKFRDGMKKFRDDEIPNNSGTCPGQGMEYILADIEHQRWKDAYVNPKGTYNLVIIVTDGVFDDKNRAIQAAEAMRERGITTVAVSIAGAGTKFTKKTQRDQLKALAGPNKQHQFWLRKFVLYEVVEFMPATFLKGATTHAADEFGPVDPFCGYGHPDDVRSDQKMNKLRRKYGDTIVENNVMKMRFACLASWNHDMSCTYNFKTNLCEDYVPNVKDMKYCARFDGKEEKCNKKNPCFYDQAYDECLIKEEGVPCYDLNNYQCTQGLDKDVKDMCEWSKGACHPTPENLRYYLF